MTESPPIRKLYIDNLRILMTFLVIIHHVSIAFGGPGGWSYIHGATDEWSPLFLALLNGTNQSFFMAFFFFLSAYFIPYSLDKKGVRGFVKDRLKRLGIPLICYIVVLSPILRWYVSILSGNQDDNLINYLFFNAPIVLGVLWFIYALLLMSFIYIPFQKTFQRLEDTIPVDSYPSTSTIIKWIFLIGIIEFVLRLFIPVGVWILGLQIAHFPQYIVLFIAGTYAKKGKWLENLSDQQAKLWGRITLFAILIAPIMIIVSGETDSFGGGLTWQSLIFVFWEGTICMGMITYLIWVFQRKFNGENHLSTFLSPNAYGAYLIQEGIIYSVTAVMFLIALPSIIEFGISVIISIVFAFIVTHHILRKIPKTEGIL